MEAINYPGMQSYIEQLMEEEIAPVLKAAFPSIKDQDLKLQQELFIKRCYESTDDPVTRVGRDPLRKIDAKGRIRGTLELSQKYNVNTPKARLEQGLSAAILYALKEKDAKNASCRKIVDIYRANRFRYTSVLCYTGPAPEGSFTGLDPVKDKQIIEDVLLQLGNLERGLEIKDVYSEKIHRPHSPIKESNTNSFFSLTGGSGLKRVKSEPSLIQHKMR